MSLIWSSPRRVQSVRRPIPLLQAVVQNVRRLSMTNVEEELQNRQLREQKIDRYVRIAVAGAELVLPLMFYGIWMRRGFKFEESGVYSSTTFRNLFSRFRPTK